MSDSAALEFTTNKPYYHTSRRCWSVDLSQLYTNWQDLRKTASVSKIIKCLGTRARKSCHATRLLGKHNHLSQVFQANGYPTQLANRTLRNCPPPPPSLLPTQRMHRLRPPPISFTYSTWKGSERGLNTSVGIWALERASSRRQGVLSVNKGAPARPEEESGSVWSTMCWLRVCRHWGNWENTREEIEWAQRSYEETQHEQWDSSACMDQTAQGGLGGCQSEAGGSQLLKEETIEAIHIHQQWITSNLDWGHILSPVWHPLLWTPPPLH